MFGWLLAAWLLGYLLTDRLLAGLLATWLARWLAAWLPICLPEYRSLKSPYVKRIFSTSRERTRIVSVSEAMVGLDSLCLIKIEISLCETKFSYVPRNNKNYLCLRSLDWLEFSLFDASWNLPTWNRCFSMSREKTRILSISQALVGLDSLCLGELEISLHDTEISLHQAKEQEFYLSEKPWLAWILSVWRSFKSPYVGQKFPYVKRKDKNSFCLRSIGWPVFCMFGRSLKSPYCTCTQTQRQQLKTRSTHSIHRNTATWDQVHIKSIFLLIAD